MVARNNLVKYSILLYRSLSCILYNSQDTTQGFYKKYTIFIIFPKKQFLRKNTPLQKQFFKEKTNLSPSGEISFPRKKLLSEVLLNTIPFLYYFHITCKNL